MAHQPDLPVAGGHLTTNKSLTEDTRTLTERNLHYQLRSHYAAQSLLPQVSWHDYTTDPQNLNNYPVVALDIVTSSWDTWQRIQALLRWNLLGQQSAPRSAICGREGLARVQSMRTVLASMRVPIHRNPARERQRCPEGRFASDATYAILLP